MSKAPSTCSGPAEKMPQAGSSWGRGPVPPIVLTGLIVLVGTSVSIAYHYVMGAYLGHGHRYGSFLFKAQDHFMDYFNVYRHAQEFHPGVSSNMVYSPLLHLIMTVLNVMPAWVGFVAMVTAFLLTLTALLWAWMMRLIASPLVRAMYVAPMVLLCYPVLVALDRGNLEMLVFVMLAAFFYLYYWRRSPYAWIALSLAVAAKYYWVTLIVLMLLDRRIRQAAACVLGAVAVTVASAAVVGLWSGYGAAGVFRSLSHTLAGHVDSSIGFEVAAYGHSLWGWVLCIVQWSAAPFYWGPLQRIYLVGAIGVVLFVIRRLARGDFADWQKATALVACTLVLPFESKDYGLVHLLLPLSMLAASWRTGRMVWVCAGLFGLLLVPLDYYYLVFDGWRSTFSTASLAYPLLLLSLLVAALWGREAVEAPLCEDTLTRDAETLEAGP